MPLLVHGEVTDPEVDIFDREAVFIDTLLQPLIEQMPALKVVLEHITTQQGVEFVEHSPDTIAGTLTAHHLLMNRNAIFNGGISPHNYCLPILKRELHRQALVKAATSGNPKFFLGTDSAPHAQGRKKAPAVVRDFIQPMLPSNSMQKHLNRPAHWKNWKALPADSDRNSMGFRKTRTASRLKKRNGRFLTIMRSEMNA